MVRFPSWQCALCSWERHFTPISHLGQAVYSLWWPTLTKDLQTEPQKFSALEWSDRPRVPGTNELTSFERFRIPSHNALRPFVQFFFLEFRGVLSTSSSILARQGSNAINLSSSSSKNVVCIRFTCRIIFKFIRKTSFDWTYCKIGGH